MRDAPDNGTAQDAVRLGTLSGSLGFLLRLSQLVAFRDFFANFGAADVRPGEVSVLLLLDENPGIRQGVLARRLMIKRAHMTKMVRAMEAAGLLERTVPADDKRSVELWLSAKGRARVAGLRAPWIAHETLPARNLTRREEVELKRLLRKYLELPDDASAGPVAANANTRPK